MCHIGLDIKMNVKKEQLKNKIQDKIDSIVKIKFVSKGSYLSYRNKVIDSIVKLMEEYYDFI